jgi:hypothetical protein
MHKPFPALARGWVSAAMAYYGGQSAVCGAPDTIRTCGLRLRRTNANQPCCLPPAAIVGGSTWMDHDGPVRIGGETTAFGGSLNGWLLVSGGRKCLIFQWGLTDTLPAICTILYANLRLSTISRAIMCLLRTQHAPILEGCRANSGEGLDDLIPAFHSHEALVADDG